MSIIVTIVDRDAVRVLWSEVEGFHLHDRSFSRAQREMWRILEAGEELNGESVSKYLDAVRRYFSGFHREATEHLKRLDRRLASLAQLQFNADAERTVADRRVEITRNVLSRVDSLQRT
jgi:hypothetical protein